MVNVIVFYASTECRVGCGSRWLPGRELPSVKGDLMYLYFVHWHRRGRSQREDRAQRPQEVRILFQSLKQQLRQTVNQLFVQGHKQKNLDASLLYTLHSMYMFLEKN